MESGRLFHLEVLAKDKGSPSLSSTGLIEVRVGDAAGSDPSASSQVTLRFQNSTYNVQLAENAPVGKDVIQVSAVRSDGRRQRVTYSFGSGNEENTFEINSNNGLIRVRDHKRLDFESAPRLRLIIVAQAEGGSLPLYGYATVWVDLLDQNDNAPRFTQDSYTASVWEGNNKGTFVMQVSIDQSINHLLLSPSHHPSYLGFLFILFATWHHLTLPSKPSLGSSNCTVHLLRSVILYAPPSLLNHTTALLLYSFSGILLLLLLHFFFFLFDEGGTGRGSSTRFEIFLFFQAKRSRERESPVARCPLDACLDEEIVQHLFSPPLLLLFSFVFPSHLLSFIQFLYSFSFRPVSPSKMDGLLLSSFFFFFFFFLKKKKSFLNLFFLKNLYLLAATSHFFVFLSFFNSNIITVLCSFFTVLLTIKYLKKSSFNAGFYTFNLKCFKITIIIIEVAAKLIENK